MGSEHIRRLEQIIRGYDGSPIQLMEVCGTHTHEISRLGIPSLLPENLSLLSGPGCPVCVTPAAYIDEAAEIALRPGHTLLSFGDMLRVPGNKTSLLLAKAAGGSVQLMYSPMDVLKYAAEQPDRLFYVTAVGFETTLPLYALLVQRLQEWEIKNVRLLVAVKALLPALQWICENNAAVHGFIGPGHVSAILGYEIYAPLCARYRIPLAVAGFSYEHLLAAIADLIGQVTQGKSEVHNLYPRVVSREGNEHALSLTGRFFTAEDSLWRGLGEIPVSGYKLKPEFAAFNADFDGGGMGVEPEGCLCGEIIAGKTKPIGCPLFGTRCTPQNPVGPCMVSSEGSCGIWYANARTK